MKRHGNLFQKVVSFENLRRAAERAWRGKKSSARVAEFYFHLESELLLLQSELLAGDYKPDPMTTFFIYEPKRRQICAADFRDRVVHHAACAILDSIFEAVSISDSFACRRGKGSHAAVKRAQQLVKRNRFFLKCDIRRYFASVDHQTLKRLLRRKLKDTRLLRLLDCIIDQPVPGSQRGRGLPIGHLTSQYFANFYLSRLDHIVKEELRVKGYIRYMDDFICFSDSKACLRRILEVVRRRLGEEVKLDLKERATVIAPTHLGLSFLGFRVFPNLVRVQRDKLARFRRRVRRQERLYAQGRIDEDELARSVSSMVGHLMHSSTHRVRKQCFLGNIRCDG